MAVGQRLRSSKAERLEKLTVVLNGGELNDTRRRVVETSNAERLEHHLEGVEGSCRVDHSMRKGDIAKREVKVMAKLS